MQRDDQAPEEGQSGTLKARLRTVSKRKRNRSRFECSVMSSKMRLVQDRRKDDAGD